MNDYLKRKQDFTKKLALEELQALKATFPTATFLKLASSTDPHNFQVKVESLQDAEGTYLAASENYWDVSMKGKSLPFIETFSWLSYDEYMSLFTKILSPGLLAVPYNQAAYNTMRYSINLNAL